MKSVLALIATLVFVAFPFAVHAQMRGHGGPVRGVAVTADDKTAISGSFDQSAIVWSVDEGAARQVLRFHDGAVNAVAALPGERFLTGGEDGRIAVWRLGEAKPTEVIEAHKGPIVGLSVSADGMHVASASWDGTARVTPLNGGAARVLEGHQGNVNAVAFAPDRRIVTAGYDATLRLWPMEGPPTVITLSAPLNGVVAASDGEIVTAGADGVVRILDRAGAIRARVETGPAPIIALALSPDGQKIAAASIAGSAAVIDRAAGRVLFNLVGPGLPVWSLAFRPDGSELLTGGGDRMVRRWNIKTGEPVGPAVLTRGEDVLAAFKGDRGAEVFQACAACHTLDPNDGNRAGPTLHGVFGRRIATAPGYNFSEPLKKLDIVWNAETIAKLFEIGPAQYTPGTKMPEQIIINAEDRAALVRFLEQATQPR